MIPAFSPGPCNTRRLCVGSRFRWTRDDLYEQCSLHITLKIPSSVTDGSRPPSRDLIRSYSSAVSPWLRRVSGVIARVAEVVMEEILLSHFWIAMGRSKSKPFHRRERGERREIPEKVFSAISAYSAVNLDFREYTGNPMKSIIVGTAGHIDHGKTALVKALTGIDADRLQEEKRRGITIDLGFAHLELPGPDGEQLRFGFVDVPGHERFVRNMLAGVGGIDLVLLVIAADEGIKPQTREHFDICRLLSVQRGITVLTKSDLVDSETLEVVRLEVADFLRGSFLDTAKAPIIPVSALKGTGLDDLKRELVRAGHETPSRDSKAITRLPIDRVFTMKGFGTVVTGTLVAGTIRKEDELEL